MISAGRLPELLEMVSGLEREIREHVGETRESAAEHARGLAAYRHAVALRKTFEEWKATRAFRARQSA